jgi:hypothetical protein
MVLHLTAAEFLQLGLFLAGFDEGRQQRTRAKTNLRRFHGHYGVSPETCAAVFRDLQTAAIPAARIYRPNPAYLMMALDWLKTYKTEEQSAGHYNILEKTARKWIWQYTRAIQALKEEKVSQQNSLNYFLLTIVINYFDLLPHH